MSNGVKAIGIKLKEAHLKQAIDYGANKGIEWVILTNGVEWEIYRIKFEQPINYDLVCSFDFLEISPRKEKDQELLFMLSKEGLSKEFRDDYYQRVQSVNRFIISGILLNDAVLNCIRKELRKMSDGLKVDAGR
ncbi:MAG: restriction endonuclease subunit R [Planctomycetes bacterium]|nr:restriction endonuclease subunit R [Planctomycetota bacterium]